MSESTLGGLKTAYGQALAAYDVEEAIQIDGAKEQIGNDIGMTLVRRGKPDEAIKFASLSHVVLMRKIIREFVRQRRFEEAEEAVVAFTDNQMTNDKIGADGIGPIQEPVLREFFREAPEMHVHQIVEKLSKLGADRITEPADRSGYNAYVLTELALAQAVRQQTELSKATLDDAYRMFSNRDDYGWNSRIIGADLAATFAIVGMDDRANELLQREQQRGHDTYPGYIESQIALGLAHANQRQESNIWFDAAELAASNFKSKHESPVVYARRNVIEALVAAGNAQRVVEFVERMNLESKEFDSSLSLEAIEICSDHCKKGISPIWQRVADSNQLDVVDAELKLIDIDATMTYAVIDSDDSKLEFAKRVQDRVRAIESMEARAWKMFSIAQGIGVGLCLVDYGVKD